MFYEVNGRRRDENLHNPILEAGDEAAALAVSIPIAVRAGLTPSEIAALFPGRPEDGAPQG